MIIVFVFPCPHPALPPPNPASKVAGSVRATSLVTNASYWYKNYIAAASVLAEMDLEQRLLQVWDGSGGGGTAVC